MNGRENGDGSEKEEVEKVGAAVAGAEKPCLSHACALPLSLFILPSPFLYPSDPSSSEDEVEEEGPASGGGRASSPSPFRPPPSDDGVRDRDRDREGEAARAPEPLLGGLALTGRRLKTTGGMMEEGAGRGERDERRRCCSGSVRRLLSVPPNAGFKRARG